MTWHFGDVPTAVAAVGTVGALAAALWQIRTERSHRIEREAKEAVERHRAHARLISAVRGPMEDDRVGVDLFNGSDEPVYGLVIGLVYIQGAAPRTIEEMVGAQEGKATTTVSVLPGGAHRVWIMGGGWGVLSGRLGAEVAFTDRAGNHWIRRAMGALDEIADEPTEYFKQWKMYGPYAWQVAERLPRAPSSSQLVAASGACWEPSERLAP